jgi:hypothetical protein
MFESGASLAGLALLDAVDLGAAVALELALHPGQALIDSVPARRDEVDEQREIVHAGMPLGEEVALEALEAPDCLPGEPPHLRELPRDRRRLGADALANRVLDPAGKRRLELRSELRECLDLRPSSFERCVDVTLGGAPVRRVVQPFSCACHRSFIHGPER